MSKDEDDPFAGLTPAQEADSDPGGWDGYRAESPDPAPRNDSDPAADPPEADCAKLPLNDHGNGLRFLRHFGQDVRFVPRLGWIVWTGAQWRLDADEIEIRKLAQQISNLIAKETRYLVIGERQQEIIQAGEAASAVVNELILVPKAKRSADQERLLKEAQEAVARAAEVMDGHKTSVARRLTHAKNAGNTNAIRNMITEASVGNVVPLDALDADPLLINTETCVLSFEMVPSEDDGGMNPPRPVAKVVLIPHARELLLSKMVAVAYDPDAKCPRFDAFMERIQPIPEMRRFLQRWLGLSMTGLTGEQKFAFFYGSGANGKSVLMDLILRILGQYGASAKIESLTGSNRRGGGDATPDLMQLIGARFVRASEPDEGMRLQEALIKELTGGEVMLVRALHTNFVEFRPGFKLSISGNHKPEIRGGDDGIWRRVLLVPFDIQIPPEERDPKLGEKLWEERSGILNWLIEGLRDYLTNGLQVPSVVSDATKEYRDESDPYAAFLTGCCTVTGNSQDVLLSRDLTEAFKFWLDENGLGPWGSGTITKKFASKAGKWKHPASGQMFQKGKNSVAQYLGIVLAEPFGSRFRGMPRDAQGRILRNGYHRDDDDHT